MEDFSRYMNKPLPNVEVGREYYNNVDMAENPFRVIDVLERSGKFYAVCIHVDEFSGSEERIEVYAGYLSENRD